MIWEYTLPIQRVVRVSFVRDEFRSTAKIPIALQICRESRLHAQKTYKLSFAYKHSICPRRTYFNFERDVFDLVIEEDVPGTFWPTISDWMLSEHILAFTTLMEDSCKIKYMTASMRVLEKLGGSADRVISHKNQVENLAINHFTGLKMRITIPDGVAIWRPDSPVFVLARINRPVPSSRLSQMYQMPLKMVPWGIGRMDESYYHETWEKDLDLVDLFSKFESQGNINWNSKCSSSRKVSVW
jgi:hypothetical protein